MPLNEFAPLRSRLYRVYDVRVCREIDMDSQDVGSSQFDRQWSRYWRYLEAVRKGSAAHGGGYTRLRIGFRGFLSVVRSGSRKRLNTGVADE
jgi:hypothetical protein